MAGIYLHIPFCRRKCAYCDFYSVARPSLIEPFVRALKQEIQQTQIKETINTIYFGGGTPSILSESALSETLNLIFTKFNVSKRAEITLEANPEDVLLNRLKMWKKAGINRLSIGIQSLHNTQLKNLKRNHSSEDALQCMDHSLQVGFTNISADLIYGLPDLSISQWEHSIQTLLSTGITHLSAYHLSLEPNTLMFKQVQNNRIQLPEEEISIAHFNALFKLTERMGFPWYEISNFAKQGFESQHNSSYWNGTPYFGFGPSAHSFDGNFVRYWNHPDINEYIKFPGKSRSQEILTQNEKINDYLITSIRTKRGIDMHGFSQQFPDVDSGFIADVFNSLIDRGLAVHVNNSYRLNPTGLFVSDAILKDILYI